MGTKITKENVKAAIRDDKAHMDYLKRDVLYDDHHGHSDEKMTADEKHISKLAGDVRHDRATTQGPAKHGEMHDSPMEMRGSFMSKHAINSYFHKQNLLDDMPIDDHAGGPLKQTEQKQVFKDVKDSNSANQQKQSMFVKSSPEEIARLQEAAKKNNLLNAAMQGGKFGKDSLPNAHPDLAMMLGAVHATKKLNKKK